MSTTTPTPTTNYIATLPSTPYTYADYVAEQPILTVTCVSSPTSPYTSFSHNFYELQAFTIGSNDLPQFYTMTGGNIYLNIRSPYSAFVLINTNSGTTSGYYAGVSKIDDPTGGTAPYYVGIQRVST